MDLRPSYRLAPSPHQSEARLLADLFWIRSRRCAGAVVLGGMAPAPAGAGGSGSLQLCRAPRILPPSVVLRKHHRGERPLALTPDVVGDDPELAVLGREVAGEEAPVAAAGGLIVGGLVVLADVSPVA